MADAPTPARRVFVRDATGLIKEFGALEVFLIATALIWALLYTVLEFPWFYGFQQGAYLPLALILATIPWIIILIPYWGMGVVMPRSGNDYVWIGRVLSPGLGFSWSMLYMFAFYATAMTNFVAFGSMTASYLGFQGTLSGSATLLAWAARLSTPIGTFEFTMALILIFALFAIVGTASIRRMVYVSWIVTAVGFVLMLALLASVNPTTFAAKWDTVLSSHITYTGVIQAAQKAGWNAPTVSLTATVASLPFASLFLFGGQQVNIVAGEMKNVRKSVPIGLLASLLVGVAFWIILSYFTLNAVGGTWMSAIGYLYDGVNGGSIAALGYAPSQTLLLSVIAYPNSLVLFAVVATFFVGSIGAQFIFWWLPSRYFFAWSFDRIIPSKFADVNARFASPHWSILLLILFSGLISGIVELTSYSTLFSLGTFLWLVAYIVPCTATAVFPYVKKDMAEKLPDFLKKRIAGVPTITIISTLAVLLLIWEGYLVVDNPALFVISVGSVATIVGIVVFAFAVYYASFFYHKSKGIDLRAVFKEIPPE